MTVWHSPGPVPRIQASRFESVLEIFKRKHKQKFWACACALYFLLVYVLYMNLYGDSSIMHSSYKFADSSYNIDVNWKFGLLVLGAVYKWRCVENRLFWNPSPLLLSHFIMLNTKFWPPLIMSHFKHFFRQCKQTNKQMSFCLLLLFQASSVFGFLRR